MAGINRVILIGNLGKDPEIRNLESGVKVAKFPLATTETFRSRDGNKTEHTEWHNIVMWRGLAEISEKYLKKGNQIYVEGRIQTRKWDDKEGNTRYTTEIIADNMTMLGGGRGSQNTTPGESRSEQDEPDIAEDDAVSQEDDLPF